MSFGITWTDFPEEFDSSEMLRNYELKQTDCVQNSKNFFFCGDNYPVLQLLARDSFLENLTGQKYVDIIYIDPPYNTGNDFTYNDSFGSSQDKHSAWLSFMERRLKVASQLLDEGGCIFIAIDQSELYVLKLLCDRIFGEENFVNDFMWLHGKGKKDTWSRTLQQHTLCYAKNKKKLKSFSDFEITSWAKKNADNDERGNWFSGSMSFTESRSSSKHPNFYEITSPSGKKWLRQWFVNKKKMQELLEDKRIYFGPAPDYSSVPRLKIFDGERSEVIPKNIIDCVESTRTAQKHLDDLLGEKLFDNPKPVSLIEHLIYITQMKKDAVIMDFFAGSGSTLEAVYNLNQNDDGQRRCILVQKPEISQKNSQQTIDQICWRRITSVTDDISRYELCKK